MFWSDVLGLLAGAPLRIPIRRSRFVRRFVSKKASTKAEAWVERYGVRVCWSSASCQASGSSGTSICGLVRVPFWQFCLADGPRPS
ncbi:MAG: hypothetical protein M9894_01280 [Planctomycetes bacterium]|nr:hypothetical protein [Planctomycetota bacterium]